MGESDALIPAVCGTEAHRQWAIRGCEPYPNADLSDLDPTKERTRGLLGLHRRICEFEESLCEEENGRVGQVPGASARRHAKKTLAQQSMKIGALDLPSVASRLPDA